MIFDMAGTTVEDRGQVPAAFAATLAANGITVTADEITRVRGASKRQAIRSAPAALAGRSRRSHLRGVSQPICPTAYRTAAFAAMPALTR